MAVVAKIISDGTPYGSRVELGDGSVLENVRSVTWYMDGGNKDLAVTTIEFEAVDVEVHDKMQAAYERPASV